MNRTRPKQIVIRMSEEEYAALKLQIEKAGMSQQDYLIRAALGARITNTDGIKELLPQLGKVGGNLNQIARKLNERGFVDYKGELSAALKGCDEVWQLLKQYLRELP